MLMGALPMIRERLEDIALMIMAAVTGGHDAFQLGLQPREPIHTVAYIRKVLPRNRMGRRMIRRIQRHQRPDRIERQAKVAGVANEAEPL